MHIWRRLPTLPADATPNQRAYATLDYIAKHPRHWDQESWNKCFAGLTLRMAGCKISSLGVNGRGYHYVSDAPDALRHVTYLAVQDAAVNLLNADHGSHVYGITLLFQAGNDEATLLRYVEETFGPREDVPCHT